MAAAADALRGSGLLPGFGGAGTPSGFALAFTLLRPFTDEEAGTLAADLEVGLRVVGGQAHYSPNGVPMSVKVVGSLWVGDVWVCALEGNRNLPMLRKVAREVMDIYFPGDESLVAARVAVQRDGSVGAFMVGREPTYAPT